MWASWEQASTASLWVGQRLQNLKPGQGQKLKSLTPYWPSPEQESKDHRLPESQPLELPNDSIFYFSTLPKPATQERYHVLSVPNQPLPSYVLTFSARPVTVPPLVGLQAKCTATQAPSTFRLRSHQNMPVPEKPSLSIQRWLLVLETVRAIVQVGAA